MNIHFFKYQGTGNDFIMVDNRNLNFPKNNAELISRLCNRRFGIGADGLILLENAKNADFKMVYYNADGFEGSMCGNGGRCIVAFAKKLQIISNETCFDAIDGVHHAFINNTTISLKMANVDNIEIHENFTFLNTGSPHHIEFCNNIDAIDVYKKGSEIRYSNQYKNTGTNVNFVEQINDNSYKIRTYERGVENETFACGTGVTAAAIAAFEHKKTATKHIFIDVLGGKLEVVFEKTKQGYENIYLIGPAEFVFEGNIVL
jgi:diaminopimelate epimerase